MAPRKTAKSSNKSSIAANKKAQWATYKALQKKIDQTWNRLRLNVKKKAPASAIAKDRNQLLLLLGECNYMARECARAAERSQQKKK